MPPGHSYFCSYYNKIEQDSQEIFYFLLDNVLHLFAWSEVNPMYFNVLFIIYYCSIFNLGYFADNLDKSVSEIFIKVVSLTHFVNIPT